MKITEAGPDSRSSVPHSVLDPASIPNPASINVSLTKKKSFICKSKGSCELFEGYTCFRYVEIDANLPRICSITGRKIAWKEVKDRENRKSRED